MNSRARRMAEDAALDLYSGYNEFQETMGAPDLSLELRPPPTRERCSTPRPLTSRINTAALPLCRLGTAGFRGSTARPATAGLRPGTSSNRPRPTTGVNEDPSVGMSRPMTAIQGVGYSALNKPKLFDDLNIAFSNNEPESFSFEPDDTPQRRITKLENKIWQLLDDSAIAGCEGNKKNALDLGREAQYKETLLIKEEEEARCRDHNWDITFSVLFNLAIQCEACEMYQEALSNYEALSSQRLLSFNGPKIRLNMGNIYMKIKQPNKAIKVYRMALDQIGSSNALLRLKLMHNTGLVFMQAGNMHDAVTYFENVMQERPSFKVGFHLVIANFMAKDAYSAKMSFKELLDVSLNGEDESLEKPDTDPVLQLLAEVLKNDSLSKYNKWKRTYAERCIITSARLIAPMIEDTLWKGYDWVTEAMRSSKYSNLACALEISKAVSLIKKGEIAQAITIFKTVENSETKFLPVAATNLSFIYYLKGELQEALKYGNLAIDTDLYNAPAYINVANCVATSGDIDRARHLYSDSLIYDPCLIEAYYNLGLVNQQLKQYDDALDNFKKVTVITPNNADAIFQTGKTLELMGRTEEAVEWYFKALGINQHDAGVLKRIAMNFDGRGDKLQAYQYYTDCFKYNPSDIAVVKWLTLYLTEKNLPDQAVKYFERGLLLQPDDPVWRHSIAKCHRESGNVAKAIECYNGILRKFPGNTEALNQLIQLSKLIGDTEGYESYLGILNDLTPKPVKEVKYDCPIIPPSTPRSKQFHRTQPGQNPGKFGGRGLLAVTMESGDLMNLEYLNKNKQKSKLDSGRSETQNSRLGRHIGRKDVGEGDKKDDSNEPVTYMKFGGARPETPYEEDSRSWLFRPQRERQLENKEQENSRIRRIRSARASTAKIKDVKSIPGLFDDVTPPQF